MVHPASISSGKNSVKSPHMLCGLHSQFCLCRHLLPAFLNSAVTATQLSAVPPFLPALHLRVLQPTPSSDPSRHPCILAGLGLVSPLPPALPTGASSAPLPTGESPLLHLHPADTSCEDQCIWMYSFVSGYNLFSSFLLFSFRFCSQSDWVLFYWFTSYLMSRPSIKYTLDLSCHKNPKQRTQ